MGSKIKFQVFVSSTYRDLIDERNEVIKAILDLGHIPVGMEMFNAADEETWKIIQRQIDDSDYYVVIVAHRYGEMIKNVGYTEKEYDYAILKGVPTLGFVIDHSVPWFPDRMEQNEKKKQKLSKFKSKIQKKQVAFWINKEQLYGLVSSSLNKEINRSPRIGWIKADEAVNAQITTEMSRLSMQNSEYKSTIDLLAKRLAMQITSDQTNIITILQNTHVLLKIYESFIHLNPKKVTASLNSIFLSLVPEILDYKSVAKCSAHLGYVFSSETNEFRKPSYSLSDENMNALIADFVVMDLISQQNAPGKVNPSLIVTEKGKEIYKIIRRKQLEQNIFPSLFSDDNYPQKGNFD